MLAIIKSVGLIGLEGFIVDVEVDISNSLPGFDIVGLAQTSVKESRERVRSALKNSGFEFPLGRITVNLAPADQKKEGPAFDLAIAVGVLMASNQLHSMHAHEYIYLGELSLDGHIKGINGVLPSVLQTKDYQGIKGVIVPKRNADEAALVPGIKIYPADSLKEVIAILNGSRGVTPHTVDFNGFIDTDTIDSNDMAEVRGQYKVKRALEIAAAGGHNILMSGPPGSGKTMMAKRLAGLMPPLTYDEALEVSKLYSVAGLLNQDKPLIIRRPFRSPHHTSSKSALTGGGSPPLPGEVSLAQHGILFLDEIPEFARDSLETLRQPLEDGVISISRVHGKYTYPAQFMLVASMNPCPCGYYGDSTKECICTPLQIARYRSKISGPLLDRIDIQITVPRIEFQDLQSKTEQEKSVDLKKRILEAREIQLKRFANYNMYTNAQMDVKQVNEFCQVDGPALQLMKQAYEKMALTARSFGRILKVARTIADLEGQTHINQMHVAEAIQYRVS